MKSFFWHVTDVTSCYVMQVGNDAVDQLTKFNQRLLDLSKADRPHAIDGILLTKFDTIDDKASCCVSCSLGFLVCRPHQLPEVG